MAKLLLFNPSNDMALAANVRQYVPPRRVRQMETDLADFPHVWAEEGDAILGDSCFMDAIQHDFRELIPSPMGWSLATKTRFAHAGIPFSNLPTDEQLDAWRSFSSRQFAAEYIHWFLSLSSKIVSNCFVGDKMRFVSQLDEFDYPAILKSLWSSSGRGVFVAKQDDDVTRKRLEGFLSSQGGFLYDLFYTGKKLDFAYEYELKPDGQAEFLGFSVFEASIDGNYGGNYVASQKALRQRIESALSPDIHASLLDELCDVHRQILSQSLGKKYVGFVGIDMMIVDEEGQCKIHPCVEINLRMNMGVIAIRLFEKLNQFLQLEQESQRLRFRNLFFPFAELDDLTNFMRSSTRLPLTPKREHGFQALMESGKLVIKFS